MFSACSALRIGQPVGDHQFFLFELNASWPEDNMVPRRVTLLRVVFNHIPFPPDTVQVASGYTHRWIDVRKYILHKNRYR